MTKNILNKITVVALTIIFCSKTSLSADTLLVNIKQPDKHRILLYDGHYYLKLILGYYGNDTSLYDLKVVGGTYEIKNKSIVFKNPAPMTDSLNTKYYIWPPRRIGPDYTFNLEEMVYSMFGIRVKVGGMLGINSVVGTGQILSDGTLKLGKLKYKITVK